jgi:hypothetical protein
MLGRQSVGGGFGRRLRRLGGRLPDVRGLEIGRFDVFLEEHPPSKEDDDQKVDERGDRQEPRGENRAEKPLEIGFGLVWHSFWPWKKRNSDRSGGRDGRLGVYSPSPPPPPLRALSWLVGR